MADADSSFLVKTLCMFYKVAEYSCPPTAYTTRMQDNFTTRWERLEALKADLLAKVAALPESALDLPPRPDAWTPLQIVAHLAKAETVINSYIQSFQPESAPRPKPFLATLLCGALRSGRTLPAPDAMLPDAHPSLAQSLEHWEATRGTLHRQLADRAPHDCVAVHPLIGTMTAKQIMEANEAHLVYHPKRFPRISPGKSG